LTISVGSDHAGYSMKEYVKKYLSKKGYEIIDFGTDSTKACDYPDFVIPAAISVAEGNSDCGIVFGGSGNGEAIVANKVKTIRCALCWNETSARLAREHNNANMISIGGRMVTDEESVLIVEAWLASAFQGGRHLTRIDKISDFENK
jgi:ribose 5-phosphate isomerase B